MKIYQLLDIIDSNDMDMDNEVKFMEKFDPREPEMVDVVPMIQFNTVTKRRSLVLIRASEIPQIANNILKLNSGPVS